MKLRDIDITICELLAKDYTQVQIARDEGVPKQYIQERVKFLVDNGVLAKVKKPVVSTRYASRYVVNREVYNKLNE